MQGLQQVLKTHKFNSIGRWDTLESVEPRALAQARIVIITDSSEEETLPRTVATLRESNPALRIIVLVNTASEANIAAALRVPAHSFLCQRIGCEPLVKALDIVLSDGAVISLEMMSYVLERRMNTDDLDSSINSATTGPTNEFCPSFSDREVDVLRCLVDGASNKLIARRFQIAEATVKIHVKGILRKINVQNRTQAAIWALGQGPTFVGAPAMGAEAIRHDAVSGMAVLET